MNGSAPSSWEERHRQWLSFVQMELETLRQGREIAVGPSSPQLIAPPPAKTPSRPATIIVASPHPDDEALIGALPLRWRLEDGSRVINCAITLGSDPSQQPRRRRELESSCNTLGFELVVAGGGGLDEVSLQSRTLHPETWQEKVEMLRHVFDQNPPEAVFAPHAEDSNTAHVGAHYLVLDALPAPARLLAGIAALLIETEFWHEHSRPNLMIGVSPEVLAIQIMATAEHGGEVSRNPYHLGLPARMIDNVRRGSEVVGGQGAAAQPFPFAELYRVTLMEGRRQIEPRPGGLIVRPEGRLTLPELRTRFRPD